MAKLVQPARIEPLERFDLAMAVLDDPRGGGALHAPVVDGWLQLELRVDRPPDPDEEARFFERLRGLRDGLRTSAPDLDWFLLHKSPGLKLRLRVGASAAAAAEVAAWAAGVAEPWLDFAGFGSFFDQAELRPLAFRPECDAMLTAAADALLDAAMSGRRDEASEWSDTLAMIAASAAGDRWIAFELLSRLRRLRLGGVRPAPPAGPAPFAPGDLAERLPRPSASFAASASFLQTLNLVLNLWGVDGPRQAVALDRALATLRPELLARNC